ncbi:response regulator, partial [Brevundimonas sp.]|uniref:response regulator n=1 Tax=Brevundimonas sp. TaxID=1871086 RepID=UPI002FCA2CE8
MPVMDGQTATQRLRQIERRDGRVHTPVIMLTANAMREHVEASMAAGADRHLTKPLTAQSLIECIASTLEDAA